MTGRGSLTATGLAGRETTSSAGVAHTSTGAVYKPRFYPDRPAAQPASFGEPLDVVSVPPPDTIALVGSLATTVGATYVVDFAPYGYAGASGGLQDPGGPSNATALIIKVVEGVPRNAAAARLPLSQKNLLVQLTRSTTGKVTTGGWYRGNIVFVQRPTGLVPALTLVYVPKKQ